MASVLRLSLSMRGLIVRMSFTARMAFMGEMFGPLSLFGKVFRYMAKSAFIASDPTRARMFFFAITAPAIPKPLVLNDFVTD